MTTVVLFNKPFGVICQFSPSGRHPTLKDYIPVPDVYAAGRLDTDSEGLVVLTDEGALQHRITDPGHKLPKSYFVEVEGAPANADLTPLRAGIQLSDYRTRPAEVQLTRPPEWLWPRVPPIRVRHAIPTTWLQIILREGRNRQVRRMTAAAGYPTLRLIRYSVGPWTLEGIAPGTWKQADALMLEPRDTSADTVVKGVKPTERDPRKRS